MANGRSNGNDPSRLDRLEGLVEVLVNRHIEFEDEHKRLLTAQVILTDRIDRLTVQVAELRDNLKETQREFSVQLKETNAQIARTGEQLRQTDDKLNALIKETNAQNARTSEQFRQTDDKLNALIEETNAQNARTSEQFRQTDDKLNALVDVVGLIRKRLPE